MKSARKHINLEKLKSKGSGFIVPEDYFDSIETKVLAKLSNDVPKNYFDTLEDAVFARLNKNIKQDVKILSLKQKIVIRYAPILAAASVVFFIILNFYNTSNNLSFDSLDTENISTWLEYTTYDSSNSYVLGALLDTEDINILASINENDINDSQLLDYLDKTNIEDLILNN
jgi:hypothetical protein